MEDNKFEALLAVLNSIRESLSSIDDSLYVIAVNTKPTTIFDDEDDDDE